MSRARGASTTSTTVQAPSIEGDRVRFVTLPDGTAVLDHDEDADQRDGALAPLQEAVEASLERPYRVEAVRRGSELWAVAARRVVIVSAPGLEGEEAELVSTRDGRTLHVDGHPRFGSVPSFEEAGSGPGPRVRRPGDPRRRRALGGPGRRPVTAPTGGTLSR